MINYKPVEMKIALRGVEFYAYHGVMPEEQVVGNKFIVTAELSYSWASAAETDDLIDTISYADLYDLIAKEMATPSQLLEHVAGRICTAIGQRWVGVQEACVSITKCTPPIPAMMQGAEVTLRVVYPAESVG